MRKQFYTLFAVCSVLALVLVVARLGSAPLSQAFKLDFQTPPPPPDVLPTDDPDQPSPTTVPLETPLTVEQALAKALELDGYLVEREKPLTGATKDSITVAQYNTLSEADAAVGRKSWYASDIEADAGAVWIVIIPGRVRIVGGMPGRDPVESEAAQARWLEGIVYKFSARTGEFLGLSAGDLPTP